MTGFQSRNMGAALANDLGESSLTALHWVSHVNRIDTFLFLSHSFDFQEPRP
jgi:hypothetical protein